MPSTDGQRQDIGDAATAPVTVKLVDDQGAVLPGITGTLTSTGCNTLNVTGCFPSFSGTSDANGEFSATAPLGLFYSYFTSTSTFYRYGGIRHHQGPAGKYRPLGSP
jgi:hypothetical protein